MNTLHLANQTFLRTKTRCLEENEEKIIEELMTIQGKEVDLGGYYHTDPIKVRKIMRPSKTFNQIIP